MRVSEHWLRTLVDPPLDTAALAERLTMGGLEVEAIERAARRSTVVVAKILSVALHPNADRLRVCSVDTGGDPLTNVCGAPTLPPA
jgi:phenylalanyl-tRNA synthetase beta chain